MFLKLQSFPWRKVGGKNKFRAVFFDGNDLSSIEKWGYSSAGRALEWHSRGQRFDPAYLHESRTINLLIIWSIYCV